MSDEVEVKNARAVYDVFNVLWETVPRSIRTTNENQARMRVIRAYFDGELQKISDAADVAKRDQLLKEGLAVGSERVSLEESEEEAEAEASANAVHVALRLLRTLKPHEWEMVKAAVDLHKLHPVDLLTLLEELEDTHCMNCGAWVDDEDPHDDCPNAPEEEEEEVSVEGLPGVPSAPPVADFDRQATLPLEEPKPPIILPAVMAPTPPEEPKIVLPSPENMLGWTDQFGGEDPPHGGSDASG